MIDRRAQQFSFQSRLTDIHGFKEFSAQNYTFCEAADPNEEEYCPSGDVGDCGVNDCGEQDPGILTGAEPIVAMDSESPRDVEPGDAWFNSFSNSVTSKSSKLRSSSALSTTDSTVSAAG